MRTKQANMVLDLRGDLRQLIENWANSKDSYAVLRNTIWQICRQYRKAGLPQRLIRVIVAQETGRDIIDL